MERSLSFKGPVLAKKILPCKNSRKEMFIYPSRYKFIQNFSNKKKKISEIKKADHLIWAIFALKAILNGSM